MLITAANVVTEPTDYRQLEPMLEEAEGMTGVRAPTALADGGYHTGAYLAAGHARGQRLVISERRRGGERGDCFKDQFVYDEEGDSYGCPQGQRLHFRGLGQTRGQTAAPVYVG